MNQKTEIRPGSLQAWIACVRPKTFGVALAPVLVGITLALSETGSGKLLLGILTIAFAVAVQALTNMENDVGYTKRKANRTNRKGLPRATNEGWLSVEEVDRAVKILGGVLVLISLALVAIGGWVVLAIGAASVAAAYLYMGGPKPLAYTPWSELVVFIFFGLVAVNGTYYLQTGTVSLISMIGGCACGSIGASVLIVNNWRDIQHDASVGRRTLAVLLGPRSYTMLYIGSLVLPFLLIAGIVVLFPQHFPYLLSLAAAPKVRNLVRGFRTEQGDDLNRVMFGTVGLEMLFALLLSIGALLDAILHELF